MHSTPLAGLWNLPALALSGPEVAGNVLLQLVCPNSSSHIQNGCGLLTAHRSKRQRENEPAKLTFIPTFTGTNRLIHLLCDTIDSG